MQKTINSTEFRKMISIGARLLENNRAKVDALNVFPVPDGDTGTNMSLTMQSAVKELSACPSNAFMEVCDSVSKGALKGARGNSGVILSQILRGICSVLRECGKEFDTKTFAKAMEAGTKVAYGAVSVPKEGTILTVVRMMSESAVKIASRKKNFEDFFADVIAEGDKALAKTPELLPVLKKAGVVDSGGVGLMTIMRGFLASLTGEDVGADVQTQAEDKPQAEFGDNSDIINLDLGEIQFAYCTEFFIINLKKSTTLSDIDRLRERLMRLGDSVICIGDLEMVKVHVHTNMPGVALTYALELGELDRPKIENMLEQNRQLRAKREAEKKEMGMLSICAGQGLADIFKDLFVDRVIEGGQTMNPSASDIATAAQKINAENIFVFPNNKNIILAARAGEGARRKPGHTRHPHQKCAAGLHGGFGVQSRGERGGKQDEYDPRDGQREGGTGHLRGAQYHDERFFHQAGRHHRPGRQENSRQVLLRRGDGAQAHRPHERGFPPGYHAVLRRGRQGGGSGGALCDHRGKISRLRRGLSQRRTARVLLYNISGINV